MKIEGIPFTITDFRDIAPVRHPGLTGEARWRTQELGNLRVRIVEYSPGYEADHWCRRGHVLLVLRGELVTQLEDGRSFVLGEGMSYQVAEDNEAHRSTTRTGATLFVVD